MWKIKKRRGLKGKLGYQKRICENPFLNKKKKKKRLKIPLRYKLYSLATIIILVPIGWFFLCCHVWDIENVEIKGLIRIPEQEIREIISNQFSQKKLFFVKQDNLIVFDDDSLKNKLDSTYRFENIEVQKVWPDKLLLKIQEKPYVYIWKEANKYHYADDSNYILKQVPASEFNSEEDKYPIIFNETDSKLITGDRIKAQDEYIKAVLDIDKEFKKEGVNIETDKFIITKEINTLELILKQGPKIYFDINDNIQEQLVNFIELKEGKLKNDINNKKYIDLRYGDIIYYK
jgi:cell division septal protein FtsQ